MLVCGRAWLYTTTVNIARCNITLLFRLNLHAPNRRRPPSRPQMVLDPTQEEEKNGAGVMTIALMPGSQQVTQWWQEGRFDGQKVAEALELCTDGCSCVHKMMEAKLTTKK